MNEIEYKILKDQELYNMFIDYSLETHIQNFFIIEEKLKNEIKLFKI